MGESRRVASLALALLLLCASALATEVPREGCEEPHCYAFVFWAEAHDGEVRGWQSPNFRDMLECQHKLRAMLRNKRSDWRPKHISGRCMT